jgi:hypothetical protein
MALARAVVLQETKEKSSKGYRPNIARDAIKFGRGVNMMTEATRQSSAVSLQRAMV